MLLLWHGEQAVGVSAPAPPPSSPAPCRGTLPASGVLLCPAVWWVLVRPPRSVHNYINSRGNVKSRGSREPVQGPFLGPVSLGPQPRTPRRHVLHIVRIRLTANAHSFRRSSFPQPAHIVGPVRVPQMFVLFLFRQEKYPKECGKRGTPPFPTPGSVEGACHSSPAPEACILWHPSTRCRSLAGYHGLAGATVCAWPGAVREAPRRGRSSR